MHFLFSELLCPSVKDIILTFALANKIRSLISFDFRFAFAYTCLYTDNIREDYTDM